MDQMVKNRCKHLAPLLRNAALMQLLRHDRLGCRSSNATRKVEKVNSTKRVCVDRGYRRRRQSRDAGFRDPGNVGVGRRTGFVGNHAELLLRWFK